MHWRLIERLRATSLRTRLTLWNTAVVILLATITLLVVRLSARSTLYAHADAELRAASREIALAVQELGGEEAPLVASSSSSSSFFSFYHCHPNTPSM